MELPPSSDYTDMGRMSESPKRNCPNNTAAIVAWPGPRPAPTSTGSVRQTIPSYRRKLLHPRHPTSTPHNPRSPDTLPFSHPDRPMNKNENSKMDVRKKNKTNQNKTKQEREGKGGSGGEEKQSVLAGISQGFLPLRFPTHRLGLEALLCVPMRAGVPSTPRPDHTATK